MHSTSPRTFTVMLVPAHDTRHIRVMVTSGVPTFDLLHLSPMERLFDDQRAAEHYADGVANGLRACGHTVRVDLSALPSEDDADLLDFASFDQWAQDRAVARAETPEADPVARRLARDAEAGHYRAQALGLG